MPLTQFSVDDGPHNMDGLRLLAQDNTEQVEAFIGRRVMDVWAQSIEHNEGQTKSVPRSIRCAWQAEPRSDPADCRHEIPGRRCVQSPVSLYRSAFLGHYGKWRNPGSR